MNPWQHIWTAKRIEFSSDSESHFEVKFKNSVFEGERRTHLRVSTMRTSVRRATRVEARQRSKAESSKKRASCSTEMKPAVKPLVTQIASILHRHASSVYADTIPTHTNEARDTTKNPPSLAGFPLVTPTGLEPVSPP